VGALFEMPMASEILSSDELVVITGCGRRGDQVAWLQAAGWTYVTNRGGDPIVGRLYARLRLSGITPSALVASGGWAPDFSALR
jgi:Domain of unknown function (DUF4224)